MAPYDNSRRAELRRDQALRRLSTTTRWIVAGAAGGAAVLTGIVAREIPGHAARAVSTARAGASSAPSSSAPSTGATTGASGPTGIAASSGTGGTSGSLPATSGLSGTSGSASGSSGASQPPVAISGGS